MANLHVIIGEDDYLVDQAARRVIGDGTGLEVVDSLNSTKAEDHLADLRAADDSFSTPPFLEPRKVTWWKNVTFLPQTGKGAPAQEVKAAMEKFARRLAANPLPDNQHFILSGPRMLMTSVFAKALKPAAEMLVFAEAKPWDKAQGAIVRAIDLAEEMGMKFAPRAADAFIARVGSDTRSMLRELEKMRDYLGGDSSTISEADVNEISSQGVGVEPEVRAVTDAIGLRRADAALAAIAKFKTDNAYAIFLTTVIERFFRELLEISEARATGHAREIDPYIIKRNSRFLDNWSARELRAARNRFMLLRERAVSSTGNIEPLVDTELLRIMRRATPARSISP